MNVGIVRLNIRICVYRDIRISRRIARLELVYPIRSISPIEVQEVG